MVLIYWCQTATICDITWSIQQITDKECFNNTGCLLEVKSQSLSWHIMDVSIGRHEF